MEGIISQFENIRINNDLIVRYLNREPLNTQKCYTSTSIFDKLSVPPGHPVFVVEDSQTFLCKIYPSQVLSNNVIEVDKSVFLSNTIVQNNAPRLETIHQYFKKESNITVLREMKIEVIFDTFKDMMLLHNSENDLHNFLRTYILSLFIIADKCHIDLSSFSPYQRLGIFKLVICLPGESLGKISKKTKIITNVTYKDKYELENSSLPPLYQMDCYVERLLEIVNANKLFSKATQEGGFLQPSKQVLLVGPSGCGKSSLVTLIAQKTNCSIISIHDHNISKKEPGETESTVRDLFNQAFICSKITGSCIINLEEIGNLCPRRQTSSSHVQRIASQILLSLDKAQDVPGIVVIATTNKPENLDPSIRRHGRLETEIYIAPPTETERRNIIENLITNLSLELSESDLHTLSLSIARMTPGYVGADLKQILQKIKCLNISENSSANDNRLDFWETEFRNIITHMKPASLKGALGTVTVGHISFDDLAGLEDIKKSLEMAIIWPLTHAQAFARMSIARPKGVLLYGPPGCAKTSLIRALACSGTFSLLSISAAELYSPFVGDAERLIVKLFDRARQNAPCLLFIDEIDALAGSRSTSSDTNSDVQERILASLLTQMDGIGNRSNVADSNKHITGDDGVIVIGATNRPDMVDPALLRPGRFDKHLLVPPPNEEGRLNILKLLTKTMPIDEDVDLADVSSKTEYYSGADMKNICTEAALSALSEDGMDVKVIKNSHFQKALATTRPSLNKSQIMQYYNNTF